MADDNTTDENQEADDLKAQLETLQKEKEEMNAELEKLKEKDLNFEKLRKREEETKKEISNKDEEIKSKEQEWIDKVQELKADQQQWKEDQLADTKENYLKQLCGDDKDLREKVEYERKNLIGDMNTPDQMRNMYDRAYLLATGEAPSKPSPMGNLQTTGAYERKKPTTFSETEPGKDALRTFYRKSGAAKRLTEEQVEDLVNKNPDGKYFDNL